MAEWPMGGPWGSLDDRTGPHTIGAAWGLLPVLRLRTVLCCEGTDHPGGPGSGAPSVSVSGCKASFSGRGFCFDHHFRAGKY